LICEKCRLDGRFSCTLPRRRNGAAGRTWQGSSRKIVYQSTIYDNALSEEPTLATRLIASIG
jgi:hypothetical protein